MLTVYGIETAELSIGRNATSSVATVLTVYGIETDMATNHHVYRFKLQQCLPFTVLKLDIQLLYLQKELTCCNSAYRLRY